MKHHTDKAYRHGYAQVYERILGPKKQSLTVVMELGVLSGGSLRMWREWLPRNVTLVGVDYDTRKLEDLRASGLNSDSNVFLVQADQTNGTEMDALVKQWQPDVFLEDGCHRERCQQLTMSFVIPRMKTGAVYIVEDLHPCDYKHQKECSNPRTYDILRRIEAQTTNHPSSVCISNMGSLIRSVKNMTIWSKPGCGTCCTSTTALLQLA